MVETGIHLFMALYGLSVYLETPEPQRKGRKRYIVVSFVITALSALPASLDMAHYFQLLFKSTSPGHWLELMKANFNDDWKYLLGDAGGGLLILIGDALLVYRCYIVCLEYWSVWSSLQCKIYSDRVVAKHGTYIVFWFISTYRDENNMRHTAASTFLTVSTNIVVTGLITFRLLRTRRALAKILPSVDAQVYTGVIAILIESAAPLTIFGIIAAILLQLEDSLIGKSAGYFVCFYLFQGLFYSFCALSPHMIIFRVTTGRSFTKLPEVKDGVLTNPIQFAHTTAESAFLQSTFNRESGRNRDPDAERGLGASICLPTRTSIIHIAQERREDGGEVEKVY
ncbi:hypothetical protein H1R20_g13500, partial [Candolleomyces eurysporus]